MTSLRRFVVACAAMIHFVSAAYAANIDFQLKMSEPVTVTGTLQISIDVGGNTRTAQFVSQPASDLLLFRYTIQTGDFDPDGVSVNSPFLYPNGASIKDQVGYLATTYASVANISTTKVQTYPVSWGQSSVDSVSGTAASFTISGAPADVSYSYTITSSNGGVRRPDGQRHHFGRQHNAHG